MAVMRPSADPGPQRFQGALRVGGQTLRKEPSAFRVIPIQSFESLVCRLFRDMTNQGVLGPGVTRLDPGR